MYLYLLKKTQLKVILQLFLYKIIINQSMILKKKKLLLIKYFYTSLNNSLYMNKYSV